MTDEQKERMLYLVSTLNDARRKYYAETDDAMMSDREYDKLFNELERLESITGERLPKSPTKSVGFPPLNSDKMPHRRPILSLKDTKSVEELLYFLGDHDGVLSWKLDGISIVLYYSNGKLVNALTRGDGVVGKVILGNALRMNHIPRTISVKNDFIVRGEGCLSISDFEQIKRTKEGERFSNPRNLAAGIINTKKASSILLKHMHFIAHSLIDDGGKSLSKRTEQFSYLEDLGFTVVPHSRVLNFELKREIDRYTSMAGSFDFPVDGLVLALDDISYGESLGETLRFPRHSMAFKWPDEHKLTKVTGMKWSVSNTGLITPVVIFEPIELEGTTVRQANLHNLKFFEDLGVGKGDVLKVYKANKIIPEVEENLTRSNTEEYPHICPVCGGKTTIVQTPMTRKLYCGTCGKK